MRTIQWLGIAIAAVLLPVTHGWAADEEEPAAKPKLTTPAAAPLRTPTLAAIPTGPRLVSVKVDVMSDKAREYEASRDRDVVQNRVKEVAVTKLLEISIRNMARENLDNLKVTYNILGVDLEFDNAVVARTASVTVSVPVGKEVKVKTEPGLFVEKPGFTIVKSGRSTRVPKSGHKYTGYGVQVYRGETLLYEVFDPPTLKETLKAAIPIDSDREKKK